ncbi:MAG: hypothetical protein ACPIOQ_47740 [Promethearchaeia archaeon]
MAGEGQGNRYVLVRHLNSGGYGAVWEAQVCVCVCLHATEHGEF